MCVCVCIVFVCLGDQPSHQLNVGSTSKGKVQVEAYIIE